ncbi:MAG TPA: hypothetical protein VND65_11755 [Candidatus Binatia bacterium]|nr:hypothetical protein [Candidatus Binatia bacterium]
MKITYTAVLALAFCTVPARAQSGGQSDGQATQQPAATQPAPTTSAPQNQSSLGDYAKHIRKDSGAKAIPKVIDNDNIPRDDKLSVIGEASASAASTSEAEKPDAEAKSGEPKQDDEQEKKKAAWKQWQEKLSSQKESIDLASRELDVLQREYQLRAAAMYGDAGSRLRNEANWDKQDTEYKQKIADKQKAVDEAKQKLSDMQEEARKAGVPSGMIE